MALKDINTTPTSGMKSEAEKGLKWRKEFGRGGTEVGVARARDIINGNLSISTIKRMFSFFSRHEVDKKAEGFRPGEEGYPSAGRIAWALWGGDSGFSWSKRKVKEIEREEEEKNTFDMKDNKEIRVYSTDCEVRMDESSDVINVSGYASLFEHESRDLGFYETISRGAFDGRLDDNVILTYNHDMNAILDRNQGGTLKLSVDERGLRYDGTLPNTSTGRDVAELMRRGLLYESSFAFTVEEDEWSEEDDVYKRNITKIGRLFDVSIVGVGAYANTDVALRALNEIKQDEVVEEQKECDNKGEESLRVINYLQNELNLKKRI